MKWILFPWVKVAKAHWSWYKENTTDKEKYKANYTYANTLMQ